MDTVRFGRVLGMGARHAAKTLLSAVDAAAAPNPATLPATSQAIPPPQTSARPSARPDADPDNRIHNAPKASASVTPQPAARRSASEARAAVTHSVAQARGIAEGSRRFGRAVWRPAVRLSGVLWLELTGVFFGLFALVAALAVWKLRGAAHALASNGHARNELLVAAGMTLLFGYFSLSSFLSARSRSRRP